MDVAASAKDPGTQVNDLVTMRLQEQENRELKAQVEQLKQENDSQRSAMAKKENGGPGYGTVLAATVVPIIGWGYLALSGMDHLVDKALLDAGCPALLQLQERGNQLQQFYGLRTSGRVFGLDGSQLHESLTLFGADPLAIAKSHGKADRVITKASRVHPAGSIVCGRACPHACGAMLELNSKDNIAGGQTICPRCRKSSPLPLDFYTQVCGPPALGVYVATNGKGDRVSQVHTTFKSKEAMNQAAQEMQQKDRQDQVFAYEVPQGHTVTKVSVWCNSGCVSRLQFTCANGHTSTPMGGGDGLELFEEAPAGCALHHMDGLIDNRSGGGLVVLRCWWTPIVDAAAASASSNSSETKGASTETDQEQASTLESPVDIKIALPQETSFPKGSSPSSESPTSPSYVEHQRYLPLKGWSSKYLSKLDPAPFTVQDSRAEPPPFNYVWGPWEYAVDSRNFSYHTEQNKIDCVRRRRWSRILAPPDSNFGLSDYPTFCLEATRDSRCRLLVEICGRNTQLAHAMLVCHGTDLSTAIESVALSDPDDLPVTMMQIVLQEEKVSSGSYSNAVHALSNLPASVKDRVKQTPGTYVYLTDTQEAACLSLRSKLGFTGMNYVANLKLFKIQ